MTKASKLQNKLLGYYIPISWLFPKILFFKFSKILIFKIFGYLWGWDIAISTYPLYRPVGFNPPTVTAILPNNNQNLLIMEKQLSTEAAALAADTMVESGNFTTLEKMTIAQFKQRAGSNSLQICKSEKKPGAFFFICNGMTWPVSKTISKNGGTVQRPLISRNRGADGEEFYLLQEAVDVKTENIVQTL